MSLLTARQSGMTSAQQQPLARLCSRASLRTFCSTFMLLTTNNYKEQLNRHRKYLGTSRVILNCEHVGKHEEEFLELCTAFGRSSAFENVASVKLDAPHLPLDGRFIDVLGKGKPLLKELDIEAWTFHSAQRDMWASFKQLHSLDIDLSDGRHFPNCFNDLLHGLPPLLKRRLAIENRGPHYGALDCSLLPLGVSSYSLKGLTLENWAQFLRRYKSFLRPDIDCKRGTP